MRALALTSVALAIAAAACTKPAPEPLQLEGNLLTVNNRTSNDWTHVQVWLNTYYRITRDSIRSGERFQAPLDVFVAGFGQRFDFRAAQVRDLRLTAQLSDGTPIEIKKDFTESGLNALKPRR